MWALARSQPSLARSQARSLAMDSTWKKKPDGPSARLDELAATRAFAMTPKSPMKMGPVTVPALVREKPPSIFRSGAPPAAK